MGGFYKKSEAGLVAIVIIVIVVIFFGWLINLNQRECKSNKDCDSGSYCGSDFSCHQYPNIQQTVVEYKLIGPSIILGLAIVIAALVLRWKRWNSKKESS